MHSMPHCECWSNSVMTERITATPPRPDCCRKSIRSTCSKNLAGATTKGIGIGPAQGAASGTAPAVTPPEVDAAPTGAVPTDSGSAEAVIAPRQNKADHDIEDQEVAGPAEPVDRSARKPHTPDTRRSHTRHSATVSEPSGVGDAGAQRKSGPSSFRRGHPGRFRTPAERNHDPSPDRAQAGQASADTES
jgi:hypothetical protein